MAVYNRFDYMPERAEALHQWSERLEVLVGTYVNVEVLKQTA